MSHLFILAQISPPEASNRAANLAPGAKTRQGRPRGLDAPKGGTPARSNA